MFQRFDTPHLSVLGLMVLMALVMIWQRKRWMEQGMMVAMLLSWPVSVLSRCLMGDLNLENSLPIQLCDVAAFAGVLALWKRYPLACELVYFFGLAGTLQGLITPNLQQEFPHVRFFSFFLTHCSVVIVALYVVLGLRVRPRAWSVGRMLVCILSWAAAVGVINAVLHTNYGFLCSKPPVASLMDALGPWPWYIAALVGLATLFFSILDLPFMVMRLRSRAGR